MKAKLRFLSGVPVPVEVRKTLTPFHKKVQELGVPFPAYPFFFQPLGISASVTG
jgi:hypothetical protein